MLPTGLREQLLYCLRFGLLGLGLGVLYDLLRAVRMHFRLRRWGTAALDALFCILSLICFLLLMLRGTDGRLRFYLLLGLVLGFFLYRKLVSVWVLRGLLWLLRLAGQAVGLVKETILWLFSFPRGN